MSVHYFNLCDPKYLRPKLTKSIVIQQHIVKKKFMLFYLTLQNLFKITQNIS